MGCWRLLILCCVLSCLAVPKMLPAWQVDAGAITFVMDGANIMSPGFTSEGGMDNEARSVKTNRLDEGMPVVRRVGVVLR